VDPFPCIELLQSFLASLSASGALISALRLITKAAFDNSQDELRKGASMFNPLFILLHVILFRRKVVKNEPPFLLLENGFLMIVLEGLLFVFHQNPVAMQFSFIFYACK
jgi:hypothetical protein